MLEISSILEVEEKLEGIEAVIFDLDDTLYSEKDYVRSGYRKIGEAFPEVPDMADKLWEVFLRGGKALDEVFSAEGIEERKGEALNIYRFQLPDIEPYDGVLRMLSDISATRKVGIITDGRPEGQRAKLKALGLEGYETIVTDELGGAQFRKPNEAAFVLMQQRMNVPFSKMVYVGDNISKDFIAPDKLGMKSIRFVNPDGIYSGRK